jgi:hypothetical protein
MARAYSASACSCGWRGIRGPSAARNAILIGVVLWLLIEGAKEVWAVLTGIVGLEGWGTVPVLLLLAGLNVVVGWRTLSGG